MTFNNLYALYENACLDYEVSVLTEGADSEEAKTAKAKKTGLASKIFASIGAAFEKLGQMIMRVLTFIKRRFVRDKVKLANEIRITPANTYKKYLSDVISYSLAIDEEGYTKGVTKATTKRSAEMSPLDLTDMSYGPGSVIDKTSYQEVLEKAKRITSKYERLEKAASHLMFISSDDKQKENPAMIKAIAYRSILKALSSITTRIDRDMKEIKNNAVPEDVAPADDKKEKVDANNESAMFGGLTRNELRAQLLIEAADLLNEGAARDERKQIIRDIKLKRKTEEMKSFLKGTMDKEDAKKYYNELMKSFSEIEKRALNIPEEDSNDAGIGWLKWISHSPVGILVTALAIAGEVAVVHVTNNSKLAIATGLVGAVGNVASYIGVSKVEKPDGTIEYNWNKKYAMNKLSKLKNKVMSVYSKKYED